MLLLLPLLLLGCARHPPPEPPEPMPDRPAEPRRFEGAALYDGPTPTTALAATLCWTEASGEHESEVYLLLSIDADSPHRIGLAEVLGCDERYGSEQQLELLCVFEESVAMNLPRGTGLAMETGEHTFSLVQRDDRLELEHTVVRPWNWPEYQVEITTHPIIETPPELEWSMAPPKRCDSES